jgi:GAF domain-containing protein
VTTSIGKKQSISPHEKRLALLSRCLQEIREAQNPEGVCTKVIAYLQQEFAYPLVWVGGYDGDQKLLQGIESTSQLKTIQALQGPLSLTSGELVEQVISQLRPMMVPDLRAEQRGGQWTTVAQKLGIQGALIFPLHYRERCHGVLVLGSERWGMLAKTEEKAILSMVTGEMGTALQHLCRPQPSTQAVGNTEAILAQTIQHLHEAGSLDQRLEVAANAIQTHLNASRVVMYWFESEGRFFWPRAIAPQKNARKGATAANSPPSSPGIGAEGQMRLEVKQCVPFYQTLAKNTCVEITPLQSSLNLETTSRMVELLQVKSFLAVPLWLNNRLYGCIALEETKPRPWGETEQKYVQGVAQVLALSCGLDRVDRETQRVQANQALVNNISQVIRTEQNWTTALKNTAEKLTEHFQVERMLLLAYDGESHAFSVGFQYQVGRMKEMSEHFPGLSEVDWRMLEERPDTIAIEDLGTDLRFLQWRSIFLSYEVQSLLVCRTTAHLPLEGILILTHSQSRTWGDRDLSLFQTVAHQLGGLLHQWQMQRELDQQKSLYQTLQWGLNTIQQIRERERLENLVVQSIAQLLNAPLVLLLTWQPRRPVGQIAALSVSNPQFQLPKTDVKISLHDVFVQQILATDGILHLTVDQLLPDTLQWLNAAGIEQVLGLALRTNPEDEPLGVMIVAAQGAHFWAERTLSVFGIFVNQLAWFRRSLLQIDRLKASQLQLRQLNWYKQFRILELKRSLELASNALNALTSGQKSPNITPKVYYQQALGQVNHVMNTMMQLLRQEQWQLQLTKQTTSLASYLKRSLERIDPLVRQHHFWLQVHAENTSLDLAGDIPKLEGILYQLLLFSCSRCPEQGRIDLWCRLLDETTLDLSITDNGAIEPRLLAELQDGPPKDALTPSALEQQPGMVLFICQKILSTLGGSLEFYHLEDGRVMSRMVLPFIVKS